MEVRSAQHLAINSQGQEHIFDLCHIALQYMSQSLASLKTPKVKVVSHDAFMVRIQHQYSLLTYFYKLIQIINASPNTDIKGDARKTRPNMTEKLLTGM